MLALSPREDTRAETGRGPGALAAEAGPSSTASRSLTPSASGLGGGLAVSFIEQPDGGERTFAGLGVGGV